MKAQDNVTYAIIMNDKVVNIFTKETMSEWNENDIHVVEIPKKQVGKVAIGTEYKDNTFNILEYTDTKDNITYALLEDNKVKSIFTRESIKQYPNTWDVVEIPQELEKYIDIDTLYDKEAKSFTLDIEKIRQQAMNAINSTYNNVIIEIMGENTPISEMLSWETQEREAKAYLETKDIAQAPSISLMAQSQNRDLEEFANKIIEKSTKYRTASSFLIGYRQKIIKDIEAAATIEAILAVNFDMQYVLQTLQDGTQAEQTETTNTKAKTTKAKTTKAKSN